MEHRKAVKLLETAVVQTLNADERRWLDEHLSHCAQCRAAERRIYVMEERLRSSLQARYPFQEDTSNQVSSILEETYDQSNRGKMRRKLIGSLAGAALVLALILLMVWSIQTFIPQSIPGVSSTSTASMPDVTGEPERIGVPTGQPTETPAPLASATPEVPSQSSSLFPNVQFLFEAEMPDELDQAVVYLQATPEPVTPDAIRLAATRFGLSAPLYQQPGEGLSPVYLVSDGLQMMTFAYDSADFFDYWLNYSQALSVSEQALPFEQSAAIAEAFLKDLGLLESPHRIEALPGENGGVHFVRLLENAPVIYGIGYTPSVVDLDVLVGADGAIRRLRYSKHEYSANGSFPIISAQDAWQTFLSGQATERTRYAVNQPQALGSPETWIRTYPRDQSIDLYGYVSVLQPLEAGTAPLVFVNNWPVTGQNAATLAGQANPYTFIQAWGRLVDDAQGRTSFNLEGWQVSPYEDLSLMGKISHQDGQTWLQSESGRLMLTDVPEELQDGQIVYVRGVRTQEDQLDWSNIQRAEPDGGGSGMYDACGGGGGGGGGGSEASPTGMGGRFRQVSLVPKEVGAAPTEMPVIGPYQVGDEVDGVEGTISLTSHRFADGSQVLETDFWSEMWGARLAGPLVEALADYQALPIRLWGRVSGFLPDGRPIINLERYEEMYPGLRIQAWLGTWQIVTLEELPVLLFTTEDGQTFVLGRSIDYGPDVAVGLQGDRVILEGLALPDQTFGGYPVLQEQAGSVAGDITDLSNYQISSNQPGIWDDSEDLSGVALALQGKATVEQVELVYAAASLQGCGGLGEDFPADAPWLIVQPVWRFIAKFEDGRIFEIQIQALDETYLN